MEKSELSNNPMRVPQLIANVLLLYIIAMFAVYLWFWYVPIVIIWILNVRKSSGRRKIEGNAATLFLLAFPMVIFVGSFIHYGDITIWGWPYIASLISFLGFVAACLGATLNIAIGIRQHKNQPHHTLIRPKRILKSLASSESKHGTAMKSVTMEKEPAIGWRQWAARGLTFLPIAIAPIVILFIYVVNGNYEIFEVLFAIFILPLTYFGVAFIFALVALGNPFFGGLGIILHSVFWLCLFIFLDIPYTNLDDPIAMLIAYSLLMIGGIIYLALWHKKKTLKLSGNYS